MANVDIFTGTAPGRDGGTVVVSYFKCRKCGYVSSTLTTGQDKRGDIDAARTNGALQVMTWADKHFRQTHPGEKREFKQTDRN